MDVTPDLRILRIRPDSGRVPSFEPGQFIFVGIAAPTPGEKPLVRPYSIASGPAERSYVEVFIRRIEEGTLTTPFWRFAVEDRFWLEDRARGTFTIQHVAPDRNIVAVATGTGVGPFISMLRAYHGRRRWRRFVLLHGVREFGDTGYSDECAAMADRDPSITYVPIASRDPERAGATRPQGRVQDLLAPDRFGDLAGFALVPTSCDLLLCGNPDMVRDVSAWARNLGFESGTREKPGSLHFERYW
jgi:ferredoxin--NADP+ reductase